MIQLSPFLTFLAANTATEARAEWLNGPSADLYRKEQNVPIADYIDKVRELEASPGLQGQTAAQLAQRIRRMHYSTVTEARRTGASENMDTLISNTTYSTLSSETPPLTAPDLVTQDLLNFFWSCDSVTTRRNHSLDISHVWVIVDLMLAGRSVAAVISEVPLDADDLQPLLSWAGDLANVVNEYTKVMTALPKRDRVKPAQIASMEAAIVLKAGIDDMIADIDAIVLGNIARSAGATLKLSTMLEEYYKDDDKTQAQTRALKRPCSARRFHYFVAMATPKIPAENATITEGAELNVTLKKADAIELFKPFLLDVADDVAVHPILHEASWLVDDSGREIYDQLCEKFADFLIEGLRSGDVKWPPAQWT